MTRSAFALGMALLAVVAAVDAQDASMMNSKAKDHVVFVDSSPRPKIIGVAGAIAGVSTDAVLSTTDGRLFHVLILSSGFPDTTYPAFGTLPGYYSLPDCAGQRYTVVAQAPPLVAGAYVRNHIAILDPVEVVGNQWSLGIVSEAVAGFGGTTCQVFTPAPGAELPLGKPVEVDLNDYGFVPPFRAELR